jgi:phosphoglycolate phosphatase-like HAD superfamily hydrolase
MRYSVFLHVVQHGLVPCRSPLVGDERAHLLAAHDAQQITVGVEIEHPQRQLVVAAHDDRGGVHHIQPLVEHLVKVRRG